jgi:hypothetical protein
MAMHALDLAPFWLRLIGGFAAGAATWMVALDFGSALIGRWVTLEHPAARLGVCAAAGYALLGSVVALLGLAGLIHPISLWLIILIGLAFLPRFARGLRQWRTVFGQAREALAQADNVSRLAIAVLALAVCTALVNAALPAVWWDPIAYHLPLAVAALWHGGFAFDAQMVQSGFPLLGEAAALPAYSIAGSAGAAMATVGAGLCITLLVCALGDWISAGCGPIAAMLTASSGLWLWLAPSFYVDVPFAMFVVAAIVVIALPKTGGAHAMVAIAGSLCGAAAAVKYSGLALALVVLVAVLWMSASSWRATLVGFSGGFALVAAGWYARSYVLTGDPVYPFLSATFAKALQTREFGARYVDMTRQWCGGGTTLTDLVTLPYRLIPDPKHFCGDPGLALRIGIVFALAAVLLVKRARVIALIGAAFTLVWFASSQQWRFALPALFLYAGVVAAGAAATGARLRQISAVVLVLLGAYGVATQWVPVLRSEATSSIVPAFAYIRGAQSAAQYLDARLETFAAARWLAEHGIAGERVVALDDVRDYYLPRGTSWANPYYQQSLAIDWQVPSRARYAALRARGVTYMVVNRNQAYLHRTPTGVDWTVLAADERSGMREVFSANDVSIYDLSGVR